MKLVRVGDAPLNMTNRLQRKVSQKYNNIMNAKCHKSIMSGNAKCHKSIMSGNAKCHKNIMSGNAKCH